MLSKPMCLLPFPRRVRPAWAARLFALGLALSGCDDERLASREEACLRYCEKLDLCDERTDRAGCVQQCGDDPVRSDVYHRARATCVEQHSCNTWQGEVDVMGRDVCEVPAPMCRLDDCIHDTIAGLPVIPTQQTYCEQIASKLSACNARLVPAEVQESCLSLAPTLSSAYLDAMGACIERPCEQVAGCIARVIDRFNTDLTFTPSMTTPR